MAVFHYPIRNGSIHTIGRPPHLLDPACLIALAFHEHIIQNGSQSPPITQDVWAPARHLFVPFQHGINPALACVTQIVRTDKQLEQQQGGNAAPVRDLGEMLRSSLEMRRGGRAASSHFLLSNRSGAEVGCNNVRRVAIFICPISKSI